MVMIIAAGTDCDPMSGAAGGDPRSLGSIDGWPITVAGATEAVHPILDAAAHRRGHVTLALDLVVLDALSRDPMLARVYRGADQVAAGGWLIGRLAASTGRRLRAVTGEGLVAALAPAAALRGLTVFLVGEDAGAVGRFGATLVAAPSSDCPGVLSIAGSAALAPVQIETAVRGEAVRGEDEAIAALIASGAGLCIVSLDRVAGARFSARALVRGFGGAIVAVGRVIPGARAPTPGHGLRLAARLGRLAGLAILRAIA